MFRILTAGESHGPALSIIIEGMPAGIPFDVNKINEQLARRQGGFGRGERMRIETDQVNVTISSRDSQPFCDSKREITSHRQQYIKAISKR